jgi:hypothetical protein
LERGIKVFVRGINKQRRGQEKEEMSQRRQKRRERGEERKKLTAKCAAQAPHLKFATLETLGHLKFDLNESFSISRTVLLRYIV